MSRQTLASPAIHPFPARMAPEVVADVLQRLQSEACVLDPMMGSGTFPLAAGRQGHQALGIDTDPLALLIADTSRCAWDTDAVLRCAQATYEKALDQRTSPWAHADAETDKFINYWFDPDAKQSLGALAVAINEAPPRLAAPLWVAFSRLIVTKDAGASRARDVSHSRPHRVRAMASFDPVHRFSGAVRTVLMRALHFGPPAHGGSVHILRADARGLPLVDNSVDLVMTSPPYLTAIDYLRGHRLSLVWMGYTVRALRSLRATNIGSERACPAPDARVAGLLGRYLSTPDALGSRAMGVLNRYVSDLDLLMQ